MLHFFVYVCVVFCQFKSLSALRYLSINVIFFLSRCAPVASLSPCCDMSVCEQNAKDGWVDREVSGFTYKYAHTHTLHGKYLCLYSVKKQNKFSGFRLRLSL